MADKGLLERGRPGQREEGWKRESEKMWGGREGRIARMEETKTDGDKV